MRKLITKLAIFGGVLSLIPVYIIVNQNNYSGPVKFMASSISPNQNFDHSPKTVALTLEASNKDLKFIAENTIIKLKNSTSKLGYPVASYTIDGKTINFKLPIIEGGIYTLDYKRGNIDFTVGLTDVVIPKTAIECLGTKKESTCFTVYFREKTIRDKSARPSLDELFEITEKYPETLYLCHNYSHGIGQVAAFAYPDYQASIKDGYDVCHFGYYHGAMESFSSLFKNEELKKNFATLCDEYAIGMNRGDCTHGLGHIAWWRSGGTFDEAVELCDYASEKVTIGLFRDKDSCVTGVAMEWANTYMQATTLDKGKMTNGLTDPAFICKTIKDELLASGCWEFIGPVWGGNDENLAHMAAICETLPGIRNDGCWLGIGRDNAFRPDESTEDAIKLCQQAKRTSAMWYCLSNVVHSKTVTTRKPGTTDLICKTIPKTTLNFTQQCQGFMVLEKERLGAEGRNQLTGKRDASVEANIPAKGDPDPTKDHHTGKSLVPDTKP